MRTLLTLPATILIIIGCTNYSPNQSGENKKFDTLQNSYASGFRIVKSKSQTLLEVFNPWQQAKNISIAYNLVTESKIKDKKFKTEHIKVPVKKVVCMSTSYIAFLGALGELNSIGAVSGSRYINNNIIQNYIIQKRVFEIGYEQNINYEIIIKLMPDVLFAYSVGSEISGYANKLHELNIPVVLIGEYLETNPLGKAEWLKFFAEFFNKQEFAKKKYDSIVTEYNELKKMASQVRYRPTVILNLPWNGNWYVAGGKSYLARLIEDAGGSYLWKTNNSHESFPLDLESIFHQGLNAEFWLNIGTVNSKREILNIEERLKNLKCFKTGNLFNNNARQNKEGGNDFWESGAVNPQLILKDLIVILHPELLPGHKLYYYKKIN